MDLAKAKWVWSKNEVKEDKAIVSGMCAKRQD